MLFVFESEQFVLLSKACCSLTRRFPTWVLLFFQYFCFCDRTTQAVAYCINSTVVVRAAMSFLWPDGLRDRNIARIMGRWFLLSTSLLALAVGISVVVPFFSSLMNIYASIGIFSLSFAVPVFFWMVFKSDSMRAFDQLWNALLILIAVVGCVLGCWAAIKDIVHKWKLCHYSI